MGKSEMLIGLNECELDRLGFFAGKPGVYLHGEMASIHAGDCLEITNLGNRKVERRRRTSE